MKNNKLLIIVSFCLTFVSLGFNLYLLSFTLQPKADDIYQKGLASIVELKATSEEIGDSYGTAVYVEKNIFATNAHVVTYSQLGEIKEFEEVFIRLASEEDYIKVELLKYDIEKDIAVLKFIEDNDQLTPIKIVDSSKISAGEKVFAIGNTSNYGLGITEGIISVPLVKITYEEIQRNVIQSDITISSGNSGGALLDNKGNLIGITTFRTKDNLGNVVYGIAYSIPINIVMEYIKN